MEFQEGLEPNLDLKGDTHTIGSLLKLYLRSLPDSVIPSSLYEDFVAIILTFEINQVDEFIHFWVVFSTHIQFSRLRLNVDT